MFQDVWSYNRAAPLTKSVAPHLSLAKQDANIRWAAKRKKAPFRHAKLTAPRRRGHVAPLDVRSEGCLPLSIDFVCASCRTCITCVELVVELVVNYVELVELVRFEELVSLLNLLL